MSLDDNKDTSELFDTLLIFDQSKQNFFVEGDDTKNFTNNLIKKMLEEELTSAEKEHKTFYLSNDLYSLLIKKRKKDDENKTNQFVSSVSCKIKESDYIKNRSNSNNNLDSKIVNLNDDSNTFSISSKNLGNFEKLNEKTEKSKRNSKIKINEIKKDYLKTIEYFKEIEKQIHDINNNFKKVRENLIEIIKMKNKKEKEKQNSKEKEKKEIKEKEKEIEDKDNNNNLNKENIENKDDINNDDNENNKEEKEVNNPEENIPTFSAVPEFEKIAQHKFHEMI